MNFGHFASCFPGLKVCVVATELRPVGEDIVRKQADVRLTSAKADLLTGNEALKFANVIADVVHDLVHV